ncbi:MmgE/PrpD family protein [Mesorhizobium sp. M0437]|uniref:MmgE/PrpD family protein n=1 Tax=Mesorhizobium sp. M0437 TaxID=2956945 RepID=UPI003338908E
MDAVEFIHGVEPDTIPSDVKRHAKRFLLDLIGVAAAGSKLDASRIMRETALQLFAAPQQGSRLFFDGRSASIAGAALANAMTIDSFDAHDGHPLTKGHAGCGVLAGLLAFLESRMPENAKPRSGADMLADLIVGYEIAIRSGIALHGTVADYHTSGAWVALGVAAVGVRIMGLPHGQTRHALGIAEYNGPRSQMMRCIEHPTMVKDGSGWGAMVGATAAVLAGKGFTGAPAITTEREDVSEWWSDLGIRWRLSEQYIKAYPVCRWAQPAMEAAAALRRGHSFNLDAIEGVTIRIFREASKLAARSPRTTEEAQYSLPFPVAALLVRGQVGPAEIDGAALRDPELLRLSNLITLVEASEYSSRFPAERWADATIVLKNGERLVSQPAVARGSAENPLSDQEISAKFHMLMRASGQQSRAAEIEDMVMSIDKLTASAHLVDSIMAR